MSITLAVSTSVNLCDGRGNVLQIHLQEGLVASAAGGAAILTLGKA